MRAVQWLLKTLEGRLITRVPTSIINEQQDQTLNMDVRGIISVISILNSRPLEKFAKRKKIIWFGWSIKIMNVKCKVHLISVTESPLPSQVYHFSYYAMLCYTLCSFTHYRILEIITYSDEVCVCVLLIFYIFLFKNKLMHAQVFKF